MFILAKLYVVLVSSWPKNVLTFAYLLSLSSNDPEPHVGSAALSTSVSPIVVSRHNSSAGPVAV